jgi:hypothetical protein
MGDAGAESTQSNQDQENNNETFVAVVDAGRFGCIYGALAFAALMAFAGIAGAQTSAPTTIFAKIAIAPTSGALPPGPALQKGVLHRRSGPVDFRALSPGRTSRSSRTSSPPVEFVGNKGIVIRE